METENKLLHQPEVLERLPKEEFEKAFDFELKDMTKSDELNQVVD